MDVKKTQGFVEAMWDRDILPSLKEYITIPALSRFSLRANEVPGLDDCAFSTTVTSTLPLFMERSMYFYYEGYAGGTNCPAVQGTSEHLFFAEGYTGG